jgi:hypothetical protein
MKRMKVLFGNRRMMVLLTLAILVLAATALVASSASVTATSANPGNTFTSGLLKIDNSVNIANGNVETAILTPPAYMKPGDPAVTGSVTISNAGTIPGTFTLTKSRTAYSGPAGLDNVLQLVVTEDGAQIYSGSLAGFLGGGSSNTYGLGVWNPAATHVFDFSVTWPGTNADTVDSAVMGAQCTYAFTWVAAQ